MRIYTARERRHRGPLVVLSRRTILANSLGLAYIDTETHAQLWEMLSGHDWSGALPLTLQTAAGEIGCVAERVDGVGQSAYYSLEIMPQAALPRFQVPRGDSSGRGARHHRLSHVEDQLRQIAEMGEVLALSGPTGAGKLHIARDFSEHHLRASPAVTLDVAAFALDDGVSWFKEASNALARGRVVILRHLQDLPSADVTKVRHLADTALSGVGRLVVTVDSDTTPAHVGVLIGQIATVIEIPTLAAMREDIVPFVRAMVAGFPEPLDAMTLSSQAMQALMRWTWPGNLAELHKTLLGLAQRKRGGLVQLTDLPVRLIESAQSRARTPIEHAEREAIVAALTNANGNRSAAATALGIGRTTLYRKIRVHHIDDSEALSD